LIVAAAGNDGCDCLHVPAALPNVLAVGAMDRQGNPMDFSNWGEIYQQQGILAPGEQILGAKPGGGTTALNGTSFATPIVSGVAALLLSLQVERGEPPDPQKVRAAILQTALPCDLESESDRQCLAGRLNLSGLFALFKGGIVSEEMSESSETEVSASVVAAGCGCGGLTQMADPDLALTDEPIASIAQSGLAEGSPLGTIVTPSVTPSVPSVLASVPTVVGSVSSLNSSSTPSLSGSNSKSMTNFVTASQAPSDLVDSQLVYALGTLGYDFGSEARRDSYKQLMPAYNFGDISVPANPYDARQLVDYLAASPSEARSLIWTLNIELTPVYAIEPQGAYGRDVYAVLQELLAGQIQPESSEEYVERISVPGVLTGRTVKLYSGQVVPVIAPQSPRGIYGWKVNTLVNAALETVQTAVEGSPTEETMRRTLGSFLNRIYYDLRNLGTTSQDRALNFATTNAFQAASTFAEAVAAGMELDSISVEKSPFCRMDSDCWDVKLKFFDPENSRRAKKLFRFTIDVSDLIPVTLGDVRSWATPY
jgi:cyanobactin maturation PatA/PatG family protease